jgi:DNA end-binding protein Ku
MVQPTRRKKGAGSRARARDKSSDPVDAGDEPRKPGLARRPLREGHLRLSLVSCPVALYAATTRANEISFHLLNPKTNNRIRMIPTDPEAGPVDRVDLVKGYEIERDRYVALTAKELDTVKLETTHTLDIERFVDIGDIDRLSWNDPFFLLPADDSGIEAYTVIRDAMAEAGRVALRRLVMHTRERLTAVEPRGKGLVAYSLRMADEVVDAAAAFRAIPAKKPDRRMIDIAEKIIAQQEGPFVPAEFKDRYEKALRGLIRRKERGEKRMTAVPANDTNVIDLMEVLKRSLKDDRHPRKRAARS